MSQFWSAMQANDWAAAAALFADDYVLHWPRSGERIDRLVRPERPPWKLSPSMPQLLPPYSVVSSTCEPA